MTKQEFKKQLAYYQASLLSQKQHAGMKPSKYQSKGKYDGFVQGGYITIRGFGKY